MDKNKPNFGHGQLYVALSRCCCKHGIKAQTVCAKNDVEKVSVKNVEFEEVLQFHPFYIFKDFIVIFNTLLLTSPVCLFVCLYVTLLCMKRLPSILIL